jgi:cytochrome c oxidase cbb3-type subunit 3
MSDQNDKKNEAGFGTTGHEWDGIEEWNNPLPRWWLWTFYATIIWGVIYTIAYPAWPLVNRATAGPPRLLDPGQVEEQITEFESQRRAANPAGQRRSDDHRGRWRRSLQLRGPGRRGGLPQQLLAVPRLGRGRRGRAIRTCWTTPGSGAARSRTSPIPCATASGTSSRSIRAGRRCRPSAPTSCWRNQQITEVVHYVLQMSGQEHDAALAAAGEETFLIECSGCHMEDGTGDMFQGAPNLTDAIWLYGGDEATLYETIYNARFGVMPAWSEEYRAAGGLSDAEINAVATYVHQLGGGQ